MALKPIVPNNSADISDENPDRYPSLSDPLSEIQQRSRTTAENTNSRRVHTPVDGPSKILADEHIPDTPAVTAGSDHPRDTVTEDFVLRDSTSEIQMVNEGRDRRIDSDVGN